jgi:hypothetical protein
MSRAGAKTRGRLGRRAIPRPGTLPDPRSRGRGRVQEQSGRAPSTCPPITVFHKGTLLYHLHRQRRHPQGRVVIVVEIWTSSACAGRRRACRGAVGAALTSEQVTPGALRGPRSSSTTATTPDFVPPSGTAMSCSVMGSGTYRFRPGRSRHAGAEGQRRGSGAVSPRRDGCGQKLLLLEQRGWLRRG